MFYFFMISVLPSTTPESAAKPHSWRLFPFLGTSPQIEGLICHKAVRNNARCFIQAQSMTVPQHGL
jgi:hypothetical protein